MIKLLRKFRPNARITELDKVKEENKVLEKKLREGEEKMVKNEVNNTYCNFHKM
jgi:hypothetical protein